MRIVQIGKRNFAFGLSWSDNFGDDAKEAIRDAMGEESAALYTVIKAGKGAGDDVLGYVKGTHKGKLFSYAEAVAAAGHQGIYVADMGDDQVWWLIVKDGQVMAGTDRVLDKRDGLDAIESLRYAYPDLTVFASRIDVRNASEFAIEALVASAKVKPLKRLGTENPILGVVVLLLVLAGVGYGGWYLFIREEKVEVDPAAELERKRKLYVAAAQSAVSSVPREAAWVVSAFDVSRTSFPEQIAGWALEGVTCQPAACTATYAVAKDAQGYAITPVWDAFGKERVSLMGDKKSLTVAQTLPAPEFIAYTEQEVMQPPKTSGRIIDTIGRLGMKFGDVRLDGDYKTENLHEANQAPPGTAPLYRETLALRNDEVLSDVRVRGLAAYLSEAQFVATSLNYSTGSGSIAPAWRIEWTRVHGGEL